MYINESEKDDYQKFLALEQDKQTRIINAAMKEFLAGYKHATTDAIVREAGISKGLLFHYFGTKEKLYDFLIDYAVDTVKGEYLDLINVWQKDIFDSIWQMSLLKRDVSQKFPVIFEFLASVYIDSKDCPAKVHLARFKEMQTQRFTDIYNHCDRSLFRDDVDPRKAVNIVQWSLSGWADTKAFVLSPRDVGADVAENYESYLEEMKEYLDIFRKCFYK
ncbi:MAG: TetR/AcrR family transcriptional regulator [Defluviitaleaceae bacterium]|nr:TetR/AcrR family transcriptional regulator [Defluviitaleaceae bacterium]